MNNKKVWFWLMVVSSVIYIGWRLFFTIPLKAGIVSFVAGVCLFSSELVSMLEAVIHYICMSHDNEPELPVIPLESYPDVDILIATHSEDCELLLKTVNGCNHMHYPDKSKIHIYLCDDGNRAEVGELAKTMGVGYFPLANNKLAKAGNLNNAIFKTHSPLIVTFDADMIPRSNFLMETVPYFFMPKMIKDNGVWRERREDEIDPDYKIGFIQTPQSFYNPDLFQFNFFAENSIPNEQDYFFREVNVGRNNSNSPIYAGSNTIISRQALEEVGGIRTHTITEDFATGMDIQERKYSCYAVKKVLASGLAPDDFPNLLRQRQRWGRGCVQTICSLSFFKSKLPFLTKLSYFATLLYWWTFLRRIVYIMSPILFSVFGVLVVDTDVKGILCIWLPSYLIYNHSLKVLSGKIRDQKWSNIVDTILCPYMLLPILAETFGVRMHNFSVTSKTKTTAKSAKLIYSIPHIILLIATIFGIYFTVEGMILYNGYFGVIVLFWLCMNSYFLMMSILFMLGRVNYRSSERFYADVEVYFERCGETVKAITTDISENGFAFKLDFPEFINGVCDFKLKDSEWSANVKGSIVHIARAGDKWKYSVKLEPLDMKDRCDYDQIVFDRFPTLASEIKTTAIKDLTIFFKRRNSTMVKSSRKLPRIFLNMDTVTSDGKAIKIVDYNYHYMAIEGEITEPRFCVKMDKQLIWVKKIKEGTMRADNLYELEDWQVVSASKGVRDTLKNIL